MEGREEEAEGESMSHIPGIKPNLKEEWKNEDKKVKTQYIIAVSLQLIMTAMGFVIYYMGEIDPEKYEQYIKLGLLFFFGIGGYLLANTKMRNAREIRCMNRLKKGLRYDWDAEDLDELEERVRKLEEKE